MANTVSSATTTGQATKGTSYRAATGNLIGSVVEGAARGLGISDGGMGQAIKSATTPRRAYEPTPPSATPMPSNMRMMVQEQIKIPPPDEIDEAKRELENDPKLPEDGGINSAFNKLHDKVGEGFTAISETIQHNFHIVETRLNDQARAINTLATEQQRSKRSLDDLEQRFGRFERGGLQSRGGDSFKFGSATSETRWASGSTSSAGGGVISALESVSEAALAGWVTKKLWPIMTRALPFLARLGGAAAIGYGIYDLNKRANELSKLPVTPWNEFFHDKGLGTSPSVQEYNRNRKEYNQNRRSSLQSHQAEQQSNEPKGESLMDRFRRETNNGKRVYGASMFGMPNEKGPVQLNADQAIISDSKTTQIKSDRTDIKSSTLTINADKIELSATAKQSLLEQLGLKDILRGLGGAARNIGGTVAGGLSGAVSGLSGTNVGADSAPTNQRLMESFGRAYNTMGGAISSGIGGGMTNAPNHAGIGRNFGGGGGYGGSYGGYGGGGGVGSGSGRYVPAPSGSMGTPRTSPGTSWGGGSRPSGGGGGGGGGGSTYNPGGTPLGQAGRSTSFGQSVPEASGIGNVSNYKERFPEGSERFFHQQGNMSGVDPRLTQVMRDASRDLPDGYRVHVLSGHDSRTTGTTNHPQGFAYDVAIYNEQGKMVPHNSDTSGWSTYERYARAANIRSQSLYPGNELIWGGAWVQPGVAGTGDQEHFQFKHSSGSQGSGQYSFQNGLAPNASIRSAGAVPMAPDQRRDWDNSVRQRMSIEQQQRASQQQSGPPNPVQQGIAIPPGTPGTTATLMSQRAQFREMLADPQHRQTAMNLMMAENGNTSEGRMSVLETALNRSSAHGYNSPDRVFDQRYYSPFRDGGFARAGRTLAGNPELSKTVSGEVDQVLGGSNISNFGTQNSSAGIAALARVQQTVTQQVTGETYSRKDRPEYANIHGARIVQEEGDWYRNTLKSAAEYDRTGAFPGPKPPTPPTPQQIQQDPTKSYPHGATTPVPAGTPPTPGQRPPPNGQGGTPLFADDLSQSAARAGIHHGQMSGDPVGLTIHHTGDHHTAQQQIGVWGSSTRYGSQFYIDRDASIHRLAPDGTIMYHNLPGTGTALNRGRGNQNMEGVEISATNDADMTDAQRAAAMRLSENRQQRWGWDMSKGVLGHSEMNPGHRTNEGEFIAQSMRSGSYKDFLAKQGIAPTASSVAPTPTGLPYNATPGWENNSIAKKGWDTPDIGPPAMPGKYGVKSELKGLPDQPREGMPSKPDSPDYIPAPDTRSGGTVPTGDAVKEFDDLHKPFPQGDGTPEKSAAHRGSYRETQREAQREAYREAYRERHRRYNKKPTDIGPPAMPGKYGPPDVGPPAMAGKYGGAGIGHSIEGKYSGSGKQDPGPPAMPGKYSAPAPVPSSPIAGPITTSEGKAPEGWHKIDTTQHESVKQKWAEVDKGASEGKSGANRVKGPSHEGASVRDRATHKSGKPKATPQGGGGTKETSGGHQQHGGGKHGPSTGGRGSAPSNIQGAPANHPESGGAFPGSDGIGMEKVNGDYAKGGLCMV